MVGRGWAPALVFGFGAVVSVEGRLVVLVLMLLYTPISTRGGRGLVALGFAGVPLSRTVPGIRGRDKCAFFCRSRRVSVGRGIDLGIGGRAVGGAVTTLLGKAGIGFRVSTARVVLCAKGGGGTVSKRPRGVSNAMVSRDNRPVVKTGIVIRKADANIVASLSKGCAVGTPTKDGLGVSCVNCIARAMGTNEGDAMGLIRSDGALTRIIMVNCNARHGSSLAKNLMSMSRGGLGVVGDDGLVSHLTKRVPNLDMAANSTGPKTSRALHMHNRGSLDTSGTPLVMLSNVPCGNSLDSVSPGVVRDLDILGSTSTTTVCNSHNSGNIVLVRSGGNGGNTPRIACGKRFEVSRPRRAVSIVAPSRCVAFGRSVTHLGSK